MIYLTQGEDFLRSSRLSALCSRIFACTARCATPPTYLAASKKTYPSAVLVFIIANGLLITPSSPLSSSFSLPSIISPLCSLLSLLPIFPSSSPACFLPFSHRLHLFFELHLTTIGRLAVSLIQRRLHTKRLLFPCFLHLLTFIYPGGVVLLSSPPHFTLVHLQITLGKSSGITTALYCCLLSTGLLHNFVLSSSPVKVIIWNIGLNKIFVFSRQPHQGSFPSWCPHLTW